MQFNSESNNQDLYSEARFWCGIATSDTTTFPIATFTRGANMGLDRMTMLVLRADKKFRWDDNNRTDLPSATTSVSANQQDVTIPSSFLKIEDVKITNANGDYINLDQVSGEEIADLIVKNPTAGTPRAYGKRGRSIFLIPKPSYAATMRIYPQRGASFFSVTDTTKEPGFASPFHRLVALYPARDFCAINVPSRLPIITNEITKLEGELVEFYSERAEEGPPNMSFDEENYGQDTL